MPLFCVRLSFACFFFFFFFFVCFLFFYFFFSSRRRHTRFDCDWSSDVCSSDLPFANGLRCIDAQLSFQVFAGKAFLVADKFIVIAGCHHFTAKMRCQRSHIDRSEERRVGKECRSRGWPCHKKKK